MTSKRLFFKLIGEDFKKRIWCPIIIFIAFFLSLEVQLMVTAENITAHPRNYNYDVTTYFNSFFLGASNYIDLVMIAGVAALCAVSGYSYLHSKTQIDTYHSMPVGRFTIFISRYVSGILMFIVPYIFHTVVSLAVGASKGAFTSASVNNAFSSLGVRFLIFMVVYAGSIMAVCLTGNIIVSMIAVVVINVYSLFAEALIQQLFEDFMYTFTTYGYKGIWAFSPIAMIERLHTSDTVYYYDGYYYNITVYDHSYLPWIVLGIAVYSVIAVMLYLKRPSESAGKAIAFKGAEPIVKTLCVIPVAFFGGIFFNSLISDNQSKGWYVFGLVFVYIVVALVMEAIFRMDVKGALKHKGQFVFNAVCVALIFIIFRYDVFSYDTYVPNDSELQSCAVSLGILDGSIYGVMPDGTTYSYNSRDYAMENMEIKGNPSVMELARKISVNNPENSDGRYEDIIFEYKYTNGKVRYRVYYIDLDDEESLELLADVFNDSNYKTGAAPILEYSSIAEYNNLRWIGKYEKDNVTITPDTQADILEAYKEDYMNLDFDTLENTYPLGMIYMYLATNDGYSYSANSSSSGYLIVYPTYENTIKALENIGIDTDFELTADDVRIITVACNEVHKYNTYSKYGVSSSQIYTKDIKDREQIENILENIENDSFDWYTGGFCNLIEDEYSADGYYYELYIDAYDSEINNYLGSYVFRKGQVPEFLNELE
jgi:ABC-2 type transport system permease protein